MTEKLELYKCQVCSNLIEVILPGVGELVCCSEPMELLKAKSYNEEAELFEKHVPVVVFNEEGERIIRVGSQLHPMTKEHYIMFIEAVSKDKNNAHLRYFYPEDDPCMEEPCECSAISRDYCNIHGLWEGESD